MRRPSTMVHIPVDIEQTTFGTHIWVKLHVLNVKQSEIHHTYCVLTFWHRNLTFKF
jgi:hypothetical protein